MAPSFSRTARRLLAGVLVGVYCLIALVAVAAVKGYRPVVLTSGSMAPTANAGALVIAAPVEPGELAVGDVLVMKRAGGVLVTHRVTELTETSGAAVTVLTKGDGNSAADPDPYLVSESHLTGRWIIPGAGSILTALATPLGPIVLILAVALAITLTILARRPNAATGSSPEPTIAATEPETDTTATAGVFASTTPQMAGRQAVGRSGIGPSSRGLRLTTVVALLLGSLSVMRVSSLALFTDSETVGNNQFTIGTVDLTVSQGSALVSYTAPPMNPGDQVTAPLTVANAGSLDLRYAMVSTTTEDVAAAELVLTIKSGVTTCDDANWTADGATVYTGVLGTTGGTAAIGSTAQGAQAGDRTLAVAANEVLCFNVTLPTAAPNSVQGLSTTATFAFDAEQTVNN